MSRVESVTVIVSSLHKYAVRPALADREADRWALRLMMDQMGISVITLQIHTLTGMLFSGRRKADLAFGSHRVGRNLTGRFIV